MEKTLFETYKEEVLADALFLGFDISQIESFELTRMPWHRFGECRQSMKTGKYTVSINEKDFIDRRMTRKLCLRLFMHEVCHAQKGCLDHGKEWENAASLAEKAFPDKYEGIIDNSCGTDLQYALASYLFRCPVCGYVYGTRSRNDRAMRGKALCAHCRSPLERTL